jgi:peroxiredoxin
MLDGATKIERVPDTMLGEVAYPTLSFNSSDGRGVLLAFDPQTYLLQQATYDVSGLMRSRGAEQVKQAQMTIRYQGVQANAAMDKAAFAWTPPPNAREMASDDSDVAATTALQGKPAPDFTLTDVSGKEVSLSSLKGSVVLLDFWATWCPPCVRSLPEINQIYNTKKASGLKVYAVNVGEPKEQVQAFLARKKLDVPVLLDSEEQASQKYAIRGIPSTIIIRPDGVVAKVFVGIAPGGRTEIEREVDAAGK